MEHRLFMVPHRGAIARPARPPGHDESVPQTRSIRLRRSQIIWLMVIVAVGVIVGVLAGAWWGVGAAAIMLAISEVIERVQRSRT
jgi:uncharacterized ion transporter superfamily protein YfcC